MEKWRFSGVGGYTKSKTTALYYFKQGLENGNEDAANKYQITQSIPYVDNKAVRGNYTLSLKNREELQIRKVSDHNSLCITVNYKVPQGLEENTLKIYPSQQFSSAIKYASWSPSALLKGEGKETVIIYNNKFRKGSRQIGNFFIMGEDHNGESTIVFKIPTAVCFLSKKMALVYYGVDIISFSHEWY